MNWLRERELDEADECTLRRTFSRDGRSRAYINGRPATLTDLRQIGECLIDIHSQHEHQMLLRKDNHRLMLDSFANLQTLAKQTTSHFREWQTAAERLAHAENAGAAQSARLEIVQHLCDELAQLNLAEGEYETLVQRHDTLANVGALQEDGQSALNALSEADGDTATRQLQRALKALDNHLSLSPALQEAHSLINSAAIQIDEAIPVLRHFLADLEASPLELEQLATRLGQCHQLARKHRVLPEQLPTVFTELSAEIEQLRQAQDLDQLSQQVAKHFNAYQQLAQDLRQQRQQAAERFCSDIQTFLQGSPTAHREAETAKAHRG